MIRKFQETIDEARGQRSNSLLKKASGTSRWTFLAIDYCVRLGARPLFQRPANRPSVAGCFLVESLVMPSRFLLTLLAALTLGNRSLTAADYRGMAPSWPVYANGYNAAGYATQPGAGPAYYVARPVAAAQASGQPVAAPARSGVMYVPVRAAYANPNYFAAYGRSPVAYQQVSAGYAPAAGYYAPAAQSYYAPVTANYAPANSYAVAPAGLSSAGSEAAAYYGQPTAVNYATPRYAYRTTYAQVPVYMYRPVTTYDPITAQPVTCLQPTTTSTCQPQRERCFSWLNPFSWFNRSSCGSSCAPPRCGSAPAPVTSYCGTAASQCGQPYYPVQPGIPVVPAPITTVPATTLPPNSIPAFPGGTIIPRAGTTVPPPPTAAPGSRGIITTPGALPADSQPRLPAGSIITPLPSNPAPGGGSFGAPPSTAVPPPSFQTTPTQPQGGFGTGPGSFGTGTNYPPAADPYSPSLSPANGANGASTPPTEKSGAEKSGPPRSVFGSGYRTNPATKDGNAIRAPELRPAMPPSVQTVPDIDATPTPRPTNSAPLLLNPRDKTAAIKNRWAVVPAVWPSKDRQSVAAVRQVRSVESRDSLTHGSVAPAAAENPVMESQPNPAAYDDRGWRSGF